MQASCNNLGARLAQDAFVSIEWCIGMAGFWGESLFDHGAGKRESLCCDIRAIRFSVYGDTLLFSHHSR
jgi:hypothetical protein